ncbi:oxidative damage protection protein [Luminiphilus sp.]|nr:oxidative damage protection protein [Halieaceae bacterium]MDA7584269.1 oxidative damage protection protein [Luminiphilus sp.]MDA8659176.1 oxidative damage protection protein [Luminiphilus sp.]MDA8773232.1 oxidative damage protection protein [Luminiphilus sp.]MDA8825937.1 oxidative damage protection protein [Luminiphilus sp.]
MTRMVFCKHFGEELEGLERPPLPGPKGQKIFEQVSKKAWQAWQAEQTMLINEKQLSLMDPEARKYLQDQMDKYLSGENHDRAEGFVPQEND